jgi:hypothetical protein
MHDAAASRAKVDVLGDAVERAGLGTKVIRVNKNLWNPETIRAVAQCDIVFGCMDTIDGRFLLNTPRDTLQHSLFRHRRAPGRCPRRV